MRMIKAISFLILITLLTPAVSRASAFTFEHVPSAFNNKKDLEEKTNRVYQFITSYIPDPIDRSLYPIEIEFIPMPKYLGFVHHTTTANQKVQIRANVKSAVEYQLILIHELSHILRNAYHPQEDLWLQEGLANLLQTLFSGEWPKELNEQFSNLPFVHLSNEPDHYELGSYGYATSYFFMLYLYERLGTKDFIYSIATSSKVGAENINQAAITYKQKYQSAIEDSFLTLDSLWRHFSVAALLNDSFLARYNLFFIHPKYSTLRLQSTEPCTENAYCTNYDLDEDRVVLRVFTPTSKNTYKYSVALKQITD
jgi:hypothetical protein